MKTAIVTLVLMLAPAPALYANCGGSAVHDPTSLPTVDAVNQIDTAQSQDIAVTATGSDSTSSCSEGDRSAADSDVNMNLNSNYEVRTPPPAMFPPYPPYRNDTGPGAVRAYFSNGPTMNDGIYETTFDPKNEQDMHELRSVLKALPHQGPLELLGDVLNGVRMAFGGPDLYHHGRGFEIADSIVRDRRPEGKPLVVLIETSVDPQLLNEEGYAYVGKLRVEGNMERNWDEVYKAAVAETLPWDVDILLVSGGMKDATVGSSLTSPPAGAGYGRANDSRSLLAARADGMAEAKGQAVLSGEAYRFDPRAVARRRIPAALAERLRVRPVPVPAGWLESQEPPVDNAEQGLEDQEQGTEDDEPAPENEMTPTVLPPTYSAISPSWQFLGAPAPQVPQPSEPTAPITSSVEPNSACFAPADPAPAYVSRELLRREAYRPPHRAAHAVPPRPLVRDKATSPRLDGHGPTIEISRELFNMTGFPDDRQIKFLSVR